MVIQLTNCETSMRLISTGSFSVCDLVCPLPQGKKSSSVRLYRGVILGAHVASFWVTPRMEYGTIRNRPDDQKIAETVSCPSSSIHCVAGCWRSQTSDMPKMLA